MDRKNWSKVIGIIVLLVVVVSIDMLVKKPFFASAKDRVYDLLHSKEKVKVKDDSERITSRAFLFKYYDYFGYKQLWTDSAKVNDKYRDMLISMLQHADSLGLDRKDYHQDYIAKFDSLSHLPNFDYAEYESENELIFTDAALTFLYHVAYGKEINIGFNGVKYNIDSARILNVFKDLLLAGNWRSTLDSLEPRTMQYVALKTELNRMNACLNGLPGLDTAKVSADGSTRTTLIGKLKAYGVMDDQLNNDSVTAAQIRAGVKAFQKIMSADTTGKLDDKTIAALNFPLTKRVGQIKESLNDWRWRARLRFGLIRRFRPGDPRWNFGRKPARRDNFPRTAAATLDGLFTGDVGNEHRCNSCGSRWRGPRNFTQSVVDDIDARENRSHVAPARFTGTTSPFGCRHLGDNRLVFRARLAPSPFWNVLGNIWFRFGGLHRLQNTSSRRVVRHAPGDGRFGGDGVHW